VKAKISVRLPALAVLVALLALLTAPQLLEAQAVVSGTYVYTLGSDGSADVSIIVSNVSGQTTIYVKVDPGILPESLVAVDERGDIVPTSVVSSTIVQAIPANQSTQLFIRYEAIVGNASGGLVRDIITPGGPATVRLPAGAGLLYFNGTPSSIKMIGNQIVIEYPSAGTYEIEFTLPPPQTTTPSKTTTTPATTTATTTTTPTTTSTTKPTTTTTATVTKITSTTTTTSITTTSTPRSTTSTSTTKATPTSSITATPTTPTTSSSTTPSTTTVVPTTTTKAQQTTQTGSSTVTKPQPSQGNVTWVYALIVIVIVVAIIAVAALRSRRATSGGSSATGVGELVRAEELDERDYEILRTLKEGTETISSLARKLGLSKSVVWRRVQKLLRLGLISKEDRGGRTYLSVTEEGLRKLGEQA